MGPGLTGSTRCAWKMRRGASRKSAERRIVAVFCAKAGVRNASESSIPRRLFRAMITINESSQRRAGERDSGKTLLSHFFGGDAPAGTDIVIMGRGWNQGNW